MTAAGCGLEFGFGGLIGHAEVTDRLRRALAEDRLPPAVLLQGPEGVGKGTLARALAAALLCPEPPVDDACGNCPACRRVRGRSHPDLLVVRRISRKIRETDSAPPPMHDTHDDVLSESAAKDLSPQIRVFQIRQLGRHATHAPREGRARVFLIEPADRMNAEAQNALLKTLEEPPGRTRLLLVTSRPHVLLPTVRSRCLGVRLGPVPIDDLAHALRELGMARDEASARACLSEGRPGRALTLDVERLLARRREILSQVGSLAESPRALVELSRAASVVGGKSEAELLEGLAIVQGLLSEAARHAAGMSASTATPTALASSDARAVERLGQRLGAARCAELSSSVDRLRGALRFHVNPTLLVEGIVAAVAGGPVP